MRVKFNDLYRQHKEYGNELRQIFEDTLVNSAFIGGKYVDTFELEFSELMERKYTIGCANGTDAIHVALKALGIGPDDEVIVPAHTWISTSEVVSSVGAQVVFCDTFKDSCLIDHSKIEALITEKTKCIIPVHLFGQAANMLAICELAEKHNLKIIEDCAQAHLAKHAGRLVGTFGDMATFSFYPGKNLGAFGDAGALCTNDKNLYNFSIRYARHGALVKGEHEFDGINSRLDTIQARILSVKIAFLKEATAERRRIAAQYDNAFDKAGVEHVKEQSNNEHVYHLYVVKSRDRDGLAAFLKESGVDTVVNYRKSLPFQKAYEHLNLDPEDFENAKYNHERILSIPIFPKMTEEEVNYVISRVIEFEKG